MADHDFPYSDFEQNGIEVLRPGDPRFREILGREADEAEERAEAEERGDVPPHARPAGQVDITKSSTTGDNMGRFVITFDGTAFVSAENAETAMEQFIEAMADATPTSGSVKITSRKIERFDGYLAPGERHIPD